MKFDRESPVRPAPFLLALLVLLLAPGRGGAEPPSLVRIDVDRPVAALGVPILGHFLDGRGREYVLARAVVTDLEAAGITYTAVDADASGARYLVAQERRPGGREQAMRSMRVLLDDGRNLVLRSEPRRLARLKAMGLAVAPLPERPVRLRALVATQYRVGFNPGVEAMIGEVDGVTIWDYTGELSGEEPARIRGSEYVVSTRHTASGEPLQQAARYVFDHLKALGLEVSFQRWSGEGHAARNVVAEHTGLTASDEVVLLTAHLDDMPAVGPAPGADDNASGCVAVMVAADILSRRAFERTVRFILFTGEEQGLLGSRAYARQAAAAGENIVAVLNLDMIAWNERGGPTLRLHTRPAGNPGYPADEAIAETFTEVVGSYALGTELVPILTAEGVTASDHSPFWNEGYGALLASEDNRDDFNAYYHSADDRRQYLDQTYFTGFVKAVVGTAAHLAGLTGMPKVLRPSQLSAELLVPNQVRLDWTDRSDNESFFEIEVKKGPDPWEPAAIAAADVERAIVGHLAPAVAYAFRVRAASAHGPSVWSKRVDLETPAILPRPGKLRASAPSPSRIVLVWEDRSEGESLFEIALRAPGSDWRLAARAPADAERLDLVDLEPATTYRFRVRARGPGALSHWSVKLEAATPAAD